MFLHRIFIFLNLCLFLSGCAVYQPQAPRLEAEPLSPAALNPEFDALPQLALALNPDLNRQRLLLARSHTEAEATGWWEDPSLSFDLLRILKPDDQKWLGGAGLAFTIPLTGIPALEKKAAHLYTASHEARLRDLEARTLADARLEQTELMLRHAVVAAIETHAGALDAFDEKASALAALGELSSPDRAAIAAAIRLNREALHAAQQEEASAEAALVKRLGLFGCEVAFAPPPLPAHEASAPRPEGHHPAIEAALLEHGKTEAELQAAIRGQYPNLEIGPAWSREEGKNRVGIGGGITLPLWNRNRQAIAEAETARALAGFDAEQLWRDHERQRAWFAAREKVFVALFAAREAALADAAQAEATAEQLLTLGEITLGERLESAATALEARIARHEALAALLALSIETDYLNTRSPAP